MSTLNRKFPILLLMFIVFQPILDVMTYFTIHQTDLSITPGIVVRMVVLMLGIFYLYTRRKSYLYRKEFFYLLTFSALLLINFIVNYFLKDSFYLIREITSIAKYSFFMYMLFVFIVSFRELKRENLFKVFPVNISYTVFIINIVMLIATITGTGSRSYGALYKIGHSGWFYAANDLGVILAVAFPIILWATYISRNKKTVYFHWVNNILTMVSLFTVGTKVGHLAVLLVLGIFTVSVIYQLLRKLSETSFAKIHLIFSVVLLTMTVALTPVLPAYTNSTGQMAALLEMAANQSEEDEVDPPIVDDSEDESTDVVEDEDLFGESTTSNPELFDGVIYSGRSGFLELHLIFFEEAPLLQQTFGMGYAGNYEGSPKLIERDFHDIFFQFGVVGFIIYMAPLVYYLSTSLFHLLKNITVILNVKYSMVLSSIALAFGIGFLAGHSLTAPAVSIYVSLVIAYLTVDQERKSGRSIGNE